MSALGGFVWAVISFLLVIGPLIFIHEMGHYLVGRWCGVKAEAFSIGFGKEVVGWTDRRGTRWKLAALPLGGYVRFAGDMNPASQPSPEWLSLPAEERRQTFQAKPVWQRFLIVLAGPATNLLLAVLLFGGLLATYGEPFTPPVVAELMPHSAAAKAGLKPGDRIVSIDGEAMRRFQDIGFYIELRPDTDISVELDRDGRHLLLPVRTGVTEDKTSHTRLGVLGVMSGGGGMRPVPLAELPALSTDYAWGAFKSTFVGIAQVIGGERSAKELSGPIGVARVAGQVADMGWFPLIALMAVISINLGFINLLPIPMLDGGHLIFYIVEAVRRKPVEPQVQEWAFRSGLALLLCLMLFVTFNDLGSAGLWQKLAGLIG
ncbi:RIP metalloprotease RseP [Sphingomonas oryzagri]|uniref:Zinc metalloprotease n=1 Tax=Sphingomonas oryzagri TaxID=3042314 RepID=A0ABT6MYI7_9SPHN|nr:RIP metalloprotease RseP [Sphingomonas oryzagri]MDH7638007.1 RIP metalloprotease RseP [Sphingomonas oryzagri]